MISQDSNHMNRKKSFFGILSFIIFHTFFIHSTFITDRTKQLPEKFLEELDTLSFGFEQTGFQLGILCSYKNGMTALEVATAFGNQLKLGSAAKNNGIACALLFEKNETVPSQKPSIGVAIGKGLEGLLNDAKIGRMLDKTYVPARKEGNWQNGLLSFLTLLHHYLEQPDAKEFADINEKPPLPDWYILLLVFLIVFAVLLYFPKNGGGGSGMFLYGPGYKNSFGSGGFSGTRTGGGGGFGGGGASR